MIKSFIAWIQFGRKLNEVKEAYMESKNPILSMTLWGSVLTAINFALAFFQLPQITPEEVNQLSQQIPAAAQAIAQVIFTTMTIMGRIRASKRLSFRGKK
jgi:hypothetical protein